jgi:predicted RNase H-like nuclease (RuvC/YqgF family)
MFPKKSLYLLLIGLLFLAPALVRADTPEKEIEKLRKDLEALRDAQAESKRTQTEQQKQIDKLLEQQSKQLERTKTDQDAMRTEMERLRAERKTLMEQVEKLTVRTQELERMAAKYRDMAVMAETVAKSFQERAEKLAVQLKELLPDTKPAETLKKSKPADVGEKKTKPVDPLKKSEPPPADIKGAIRQVKDGLAVISIGSDSGLETGQKLEVYRLQPTPKYLGTLTLVEVKAKSAVGKISPASDKVTIEVGDEVSSRLQP